MQYKMPVQVFEGAAEARCIKLALSLCKASVLRRIEVVPKVTAKSKVQEQEDVHLVAERAVHVAKERV